MVAGYAPKQAELAQAQYAFAAAASGALTRAMFQPLDVLKIRFQLQSENIGRGPSAKYTGIFQAMPLIVREEGLPALWKGLLTGQILSVTYTVVRFNAFETFTKLAHQAAPADAHSHIVHFICGMGAGAMATLMSYPMDVLRTRLVAQGEPRVYRHLLDAMRLLPKHEGLFAFYKGILPAIAQSGSRSGFQFLMYRSLDRYLKTLPSMEKSPLTSVICGSVAGAASEAVVLPFDTIKKRLQVTGFERARSSFGAVKLYRGLFHLVQTMYAHEGIGGFYKGLKPSLLKSACTHGSGFGLYDFICSVFRSSKSVRHSG